MRKKQKDAILVSFFKNKEKFKRLGEHIVNFIKNDPSSPKDNLYTITYRIKDEYRIIEKIDEENKNKKTGNKKITVKNFQEKIGDLIGIRLICYRLSDVSKVENYLNLLNQDNVLRFIDGPNQKRSFILPIDSTEIIPKSINLQYSGYSSIHYQVELGENSDTTLGLHGIQVEIQLRTILEEAWGEIDHKYRYMLNRSGVKLPEHIHTGFYNLSAYLQVVAMQVEYLCREAESYRSMALQKKNKIRFPMYTNVPISKIDGEDQSQSDAVQLILKDLLKKKFGFILTIRTITYLNKRLVEFGYHEQLHLFFNKVFNEERMLAFRNILHETLDREAFQKKIERDIDVINAVNFVLFDEIQGRIIAQEGLKAVLRWRSV